MDTSGKDGTISFVFSQINPQGCDVHCLKYPRPEEAAHDFYGAIHKSNTRPGILEFSIAHSMKMRWSHAYIIWYPRKWSKRYKDINNFEKLLHQNGNHYAVIFSRISARRSKPNACRLALTIKIAWKILYQRFLPSANIGMDYQKKPTRMLLSQCSTTEAPGISFLPIINGIVTWPSHRHSSIPCINIKMSGRQSYKHGRQELEEELQQMR